MSYVDFSALKERVAIADAAQKLDLKLAGSGDQMRGPCPACKSGGDRALVITSSKQAFYCFAAHKGGDVIALVAHIQSIGMKQAAEFLAEGQDVAASDQPNSTPPEERVRGAGQPAKSLQPLTYLEPENARVQELGLTTETCKLFGAGYAPKGIMRGRLAIPIFDWRTTELTAYCGHTLRSEPKKLSFPKDFDPAKHLFGVQLIGEGECLLMRDPLEVMLAKQNGIDNGICLLTETVSADQLRELADMMDQQSIVELTLT